jgi:CheY-like chemotaxis protein
MKNKILLIEDDHSLAASLERVLALSDYDVTVVASAEAGLERVHEDSFAAAVTDFKLLGLNGLQFVKKFTRQTRGCRSFSLLLMALRIWRLRPQDGVRTIVCLNRLRCQTCWQRLPMPWRTMYYLRIPLN